MLLLAALRLVPRLGRDSGDGEVEGVRGRIEAFGQGAGVGKYIRGVSFVCGFWQLSADMINGGSDVSSSYGS